MPIHTLRGKLIASCQALPDEPLHGSETMVKMARAAEQGGACGLRIQSADDIRAVKQALDLPVIGLIKRDYPDSEIYITATAREVDEIAAAGADIIALDATDRPRPNQGSLADLVERIHGAGCQVMADIATYEEGIAAQALGADCVSTTLSGYTRETAHTKTDGPDFDLLARLARDLIIPVIAEGRIWSPEQAAQAMSLGAHAVVIGSAISRPQLITQRFANAINTTPTQEACPA